MDNNDWGVFIIGVVAGVAGSIVLGMFCTLMWGGLQ